MKSLLVMLLLVTAALAATTFTLAIFSVRFSPLDPFTAGVVTVAAGALGLVPILFGGRNDPVGVFQLALIGTVLHLISAVALAAAAVVSQIVAVRMPFMSLLIVGYWTSLITLVWQLRRLLMAKTVISPDGTTA
jgi:hypothetical protein